MGCGSIASWEESTSIYWWDITPLFLCTNAGSETSATFWGIAVSCPLHGIHTQAFGYKDQWFIAIFRLEAAETMRP